MKYHGKALKHKPCSALCGGVGIMGYPETEQLLKYISIQSCYERIVLDRKTDILSLRWFQLTGVFKGKISRLKLLSVPSKMFSK